MHANDFLHPPASQRPAPFWSANDRLTPEETSRQMSEMLDVGLSGGFFHSRMGLISAYLGEEWMAAMHAALAVAKARGGYLWLYDEDCWPSGCTGGMVTGEKDEYRSASLRAELLAPGEMPEEMPDVELRAAYVICCEGAQLLSAERIALDALETRVTDMRLIFRRHYAPKAFGCWGWESCVNWLNPEATARFIETTHEVYRRIFGDEFGKHIPGMFTDEPGVFQDCWAGIPNAVPWYDGLPKRYAEWYGRDFWADIPLLFFDAPDCRATRLWLHRAFLRQFCEAYTVPLYQWCDRYGLQYTGHYLHENTLEEQLRAHYGGVMTHYRFMHMPGIDHLRLPLSPQLLALRQVASAARQLGRPRVLCEIFGVTEHTATFQDFKAIGDYNLVHGVTFFCPHLSWYSCRGGRKRDFPPNWNYQQTYWSDLNLLNDYFTRLGTMLSAGKAQSDILLLHPIESAAAARRMGVTGTTGAREEDLSAAERYEASFVTTLDAVLTAGYECDLGDEGYLEDLGRVEGDGLCIGEMCYHLVFVPPSSTWRPSTYRLLQLFIEGGGHLVFLGEPPSELDGEPAGAQWQVLIEQARTISPDAEAILSILDALAPQRFRLRTSDGRPALNTYVNHRIDGDQDVLFVNNADRAQGREYALEFSSDKSLEIWDPLDGRRYNAPVDYTDGTITLRFSLPPSGAMLFVLQPEWDETLPTWEPLSDLSTGDIVPLPEQWAFTRSEENALVMDRVSVSVDGGKTWWDEGPVSVMRQRLANHFDMGRKSLCQPWVAINKQLFPREGGTVILCYRFRSTLERPHAFLVAEDLTDARVTVNGMPVDTSAAGWQWDRGFGKVEITDLVTRGENTVELHINYNLLTEVEAAYIVGDFGVSIKGGCNPEIVEEPCLLHNGAWLNQGYPFYSGRMVYHAAFTVPTGRQVFLRLHEPSGILFRVRVNGNEVKPILWQPYLTEMSGELQPGDNTLEIEVVRSRQNTLGPIHGEREDEYRTHPYGLLGGADIVVVK